MNKDIIDTRYKVYKTQIVLILKKRQAYKDPDFSVETLASCMGTTRFKLVRIFSYLFDISPLKYINQCRVECAKKYMKDPRLASVGVADIGMMAGFNSRFAFIYEFKRIEGMSPSEYRKKALRCM